MFKILLCAVIIISSGSLGLLKSHKFTQRISELNDLRSMIHQLNVEISYRKDPLTVTFHRLADKNNGISSLLLNKCTLTLDSFNDFTPCWMNAAEDIYTNSSLKKEDIELLKEVGIQLGKYNIEGQAEMLHLIEENFTEQIKSAVKEKESKGKMFGSLGFSLGIVISVILI